MSNGSLEEWLHRENQSRSLTLVQRLNIAINVASALCYLHDYCEPPIIHRDMKPSNILLDDDMVAHVGDFGLARLISTTKESSQTLSRTIGIKGTIGYVAPGNSLPLLQNFILKFLTGLLKINLSRNKN
jgi:serine/threonine protein kinase